MDLVASVALDYVAHSSVQFVSQMQGEAMDNVLVHQLPR